MSYTLVKPGKAFKLPTIITTNAADGLDGPVLPVITGILPDARSFRPPVGSQGGLLVYAVIDASETWNKLVREVAIALMTQSGIHAPRVTRREPLW